LCVEFVAQGDNLFITTVARLCDDSRRRIRQFVAGVVQLLLFGLHFLDGIEQRLRHRLIGGDIRLQSVVKLPALLRQGRLRGVAQRRDNPTGDFPILFRRCFVMIVSEAERAAPHRFKIMFDLQHACGVLRQRVHFGDIGFNAVELRDAVDGKRHPDEHKKCESGIEFGFDRHRHSLRFCFATRVLRVGEGHGLACVGD
jgi:hypothetical protein